VCRIQPWKTTDRLAHLKAALTGDAVQVLWDTDPVAIDSLPKLITLLRSRFSGSRQSEKCKMDLKLRRRRPGEPLTVLHRDICRLMALAYPALLHDARESIACDYFLDALDEPDLAPKVRERAPADLDEALAVIMRLEAWAIDVRRQTRPRDDGHRYRNRGACEATTDQQLARHLEQIDRRFEEMGRHRPDTGTSAPATYTGAPDIEHRPSPDRWSAKDHRPAQHRQAPAAWPRRPSFTDGIVCWGCGKPGHMRRNCDQPAPAKPTPAGTAKVAHGADQANVYLAMEPQGRRVPCLLDTGCDITLVPRDVIDKVPDLEIQPTKHRMWAANGTEIQLDGEAVIPFVMDGHRLDTEVLVSPDIEETMIGSEWMQAHRCLWDFQGSQLYTDGKPAVMLSQRRQLRCRRLYADQDTVVPARQQIEVPARTTLLSARAPVTPQSSRHGRFSPVSTWANAAATGAPEPADQRRQHHDGTEDRHRRRMVGKPAAGRSPD